ncbi:conjugal transfer protein [Rickettsia amblyommatis]|uniref:Conjugative transfer protein TraW n=2 Tax=Rickettsia amblyommatis TaxID=33989 RepID=H8K638_RICAG|nr:conjugal transfer protein TraW [Rickettsia amblyommatis]AFC69982.1 conjugative transfer protein TraW [Rickettsia amblyommatis str. GAT-30V]ALA61989.1 conjugal transfer protein traW [Rickettsia amblyommatis]ARD88091.1 conjugal transfer protein [Rickettsia amblyommatis]KJV62493.1 putative type-F conjugative transfer system protein TraW [Rickettsia amblyommatis str. Ac/Pa]KJV91252.1 putative type-F conjugative transfer system protein TraW [Rickettsia amblyommatis str. Darkwater]
MMKYLNLKIIAINFLVLAISLVSYANDSTNKNSKLLDYGVRGHVFLIIAESLLEVIMKRLQIAKDNGILEKMQEEFKEKVSKKISRPTMVAGVIKARKSKSRILDLSFTQKTDIKDLNNNVIVKSGTKINPLDTINWGEDLIFIDGDDQDQINWAKSKIGRLILVKGSPIELTKKLNKQVFFDQGGILSTHFKIKAVPATIKQEGKLLKVSEININ